MRSNETDNETQYQAQAGNKYSLHRQPGLSLVLEERVALLQENLDQAGLAHQRDDDVPKSDFKADVNVFEAHSFTGWWLF